MAVLAISRSWCDQDVSLVENQILAPDWNGCSRFEWTDCDVSIDLSLAVMRHFTVVSCYMHGSCVPLSPVIPSNLPSLLALPATGRMEYDGIWVDGIQAGAAEVAYADGDQVGE